MKRTFTKYPNNYIKASYSSTEPLSPEEREDKIKIIQGLSGLDLLSHFKKYLLMCEGSAITAPNHELGDILDLLEEEILRRLG